MTNIKDLLKNPIVIYKPEGEEVRVEVRVEKETVWLSQADIAVIFQTERSVTTKHINNIFKSGELEEKSKVQKMHNPIGQACYT